ncbi:hypothetical protein JY651_35690 [Pyxidicoccus parkwayensis]|uniref:Immunity MXAN-0049 protein domain-containing protein n=1 Tax=Pyxidicoccus parkwayensis TaxID=2813578 RepID=A0ABX7NSM3_9BACT|nr:DUF1629 domain-containing protein [Pyxidicoccus parkwaysis]QSQ20545.1 hypothetical protein JY651_35690 [Pyxidicoccus parkwaysis]
MQKDYFVIESEASNNHPMLQWDQLAGHFRKGVAVKVDEPVRLRLGKPVPRNPVMVDHHELPEPVVSTRLKDLLEPMNLFRVQLVPTDVTVKPDDVRRYWLMHIYNTITCVDRQRSSLSIDEDDGGILGIRKLVLDEEVLRAIPLEQRLVFRLAESTSTNVFHQSVADKVLSLKPEGLRFIPVERWNDGAAFQA